MTRQAPLTTKHSPYCEVLRKWGNSTLCNLVKVSYIYNKKALPVLHQIFPQEPNQLISKEAFTFFLGYTYFRWVTHRYRQQVQTVCKKFMLNPTTRSAHI